MDFYIVAVILLFAFIFGAFLGVIVIVSISSNREDRRYSVLREAPHAASAGARRLVGLRRSDVEEVDELYAGAVAQLDTALARNPRAQPTSAGRAADDSETSAEDLAAALALYARHSKTFASKLSKWVARKPAEINATGPGEDALAASTLPVTIFISETDGHEEVEFAVVSLLSKAHLRIQVADDPVIGSWFRRMRAAIETAGHSDAMRETALVAKHIADSRLVLAQDATITSTLMQGLSPVITSLQPTKDAVIRLGAVLIVKIEWTVTVHQLTAAQQAQLDRQPHLATAPYEILSALGLVSHNGSGNESSSSEMGTQHLDILPPSE
jgi:hypothetical protein